MFDMPELLSLCFTIIGVTTLIWAITRTWLKLRLITRLGGPDKRDLRQKALHRLVRHSLNLLAQLVLFYICIIAFTTEPGTVTVQAATNRVGVGVTSLILTIKVLVDQWQEVSSEWDGHNRRRVIDDRH